MVSKSIKFTAKNGLNSDGYDANQWQLVGGGY